MSVSVFNFEAMMSRACGDQDISYGSRFSRLSTKTRGSLKIAEDLPLVVVANTVPQLQKNNRTPCGLTAHEQLSDNSLFVTVAVPPEGMHPREVSTSFTGSHPTTMTR